MKAVTTEHAMTIDLGAHTLEVKDDQSITIENAAIAVELDCDEAYKLMIALQAVFA